LFKKILVADRGEIALRVIRACKELGIETVAIHSEADANSLHVRFADEDVCIGPGPSAQSYRNIPRIISAAEVAGVDAIHPGYGPLAENARFAEVCESCGIKFIGPSSDVISRMGDKALARLTMTKAGVPVLPGSGGPLRDLNEAREIAEEVGYPVVLKAVMGGGGRGMRVVWSIKDLEKAWFEARAEAGAVFVSPDLYMEKYLENPRHVEIQVLADSFGEVVSLGERDCSIQRRYQKLIEESPSPAVSPDIREKMGQAAIRGAREVGYEGAGTVEFLLDKDGKFYFMEMNTRIQVEHPVTEMVTGIDLVKEQIRIASGKRLAFNQSDVKLNGHAIECRINAEDPLNGFLPASGIVKSLHIPGGPGIRVDTHIYSMYRIPPFYDPLLAKLIAYGSTRSEAIARMIRALEEFIIEGVPTTIPFHLRVMKDERFRRGDVNTNYIENWLTSGVSIAAGT